jgi:hypothetical protein
MATQMKRFATTFSQWLLAILLAGVFWEGFLRVAVEIPVPYRHHPKLGWLPAPHAYGLYTHEGRSITVYNEHGFREGPIEPRKPGEFRILCLGDSFVEGAQVNDDETFPRRLEAALSKRLPSLGTSSIRSVRVFNAGRGHSSLAATLELAASYREIFDPDFVVILFRDGSFRSARDRDKEIYLTMKGDHVATKVKWRGVETSKLKEVLLSHGLRSSAALHYGYVRAVQIMSMPSKPTEAEAPRQRPPEPPELVDHLLSGLAKAYPQAVWVHLPMQDVLTGPVVAAASEEEVLLRERAPQNIPVLFTREHINQSFARNHRPIYGFWNTVPGYGHANEEGHRLIAEALVDFFSRGSRLGARDGFGASSANTP